MTIGQEPPRGPFDILGPPRGPFDIIGPPCGLFDIIGDVHGCGDELELLLDRLGYATAWAGAAGARQVSVTPPAGRRVVFLGDLATRGPRAVECLRIAMHMAASGLSFAVKGNHDQKLEDWLAHRLQGNILTDPDLGGADQQCEAAGGTFQQQASRFLGTLASHLVLDVGRLVVAHAGLPREMIGQDTAAVRTFTLFGNPQGRKDAWSDSYRGPAAIVYGHVPRRHAQWHHNTLCLDTGCVYGGRLTALRWPEREMVSVTALRAYAPHKAFGPATR